ncbi:hypothetical protein [Oceanobacillus sp. FSL K6-0127]|uniref:hypothetical protein n=1 Tax=Oceanobacillus sp. FSL K6-0127 TaxID=2921420 RepID=UPI0030EBC7FA
MKKKWLLAVPAVAVALVGSPDFNQTVDAAPENESVQQAESEIPAGYETILNWPPEQQPIVKQGSHSRIGGCLCRGCP